MTATREQLESILSEELDILTETDGEDFNYRAALHTLYRRFLVFADSSGLCGAISNKYDSAYFEMQGSGCTDGADYRNVMRDFTEKVVRLFGNPGEPVVATPEITKTVAVYKDGDSLTMSIDALGELLRIAATQGNEASWGDHTDSGIAWHIMRDTGII